MKRKQPALVLLILGICIASVVIWVVFYAASYLLGRLLLG